MTLSIINSVIAALLTLVTALFVLRRGDRKLSRWGFIVIALAIASFGSAALQTHRDYREKSAAPFKLDLKDITFTLYATRHQAYQSNEEILASSPDGLPGTTIFINGFMAHADFVRVQGVDRPWGYRALPHATLIYHAHNLRRDRGEQGVFPYKFLWDLDGKTASATLPLGRFRANTEREKWAFALEASVGGRLFVAEPAGSTGKFFKLQFTQLSEEVVRKEAQ